MDSVIAYPKAGCEEGQDINNDIPKSQDLHVMLDKMFESYVKLQNTGFKWDLKYRGKVYRDVEFVLFTPVLKLDSDEAEKICGKFTSRAGKVKNLCRYCECTTDDTDDPFANYPMKTKAKIKSMCDNNDVEGLLNISQHCIKNSMNKIRFGYHNVRGIHGVCPMDMLHALLLGIFKYIRDCFFQQIGPDSKLADDINACACQYGEFISRQSDRDFPTTRFNNGVRRGKLNAKDFPGISLCLAVTLRCHTIRSQLPKRKQNMRVLGAVEDWQMLIESLLQWERWLKSDRLQVRHVVRAKKKHRHLMYLIKNIGRRVEGMGLKTTNFTALCT